MTTVIKNIKLLQTVCLTIAVEGVKCATSLIVTN